MLKDQLPRRLLVALGHSLVAPAVWACRVIEQAGTKWNLIESRKWVVAQQVSCALVGPRD